MRKRHGPSSSSVKPISNTAVMAKKRAPLGNITNQKNESQIPNSSVDFVSIASFLVNFAATFCFLCDQFCLFFFAGFIFIFLRRIVRTNLRN